MSTFNLEIDVDNAAFCDSGYGQEVARILRKLATRLDGLSGAADAACFSISLMDINGNKVGKAYFDIDDAPSQDVEEDPKVHMRAFADTLSDEDLTNILLDLTSFTIEDDEPTASLREKVLESLEAGTLTIEQIRDFLEA